MEYIGKKINDLDHSKLIKKTYLVCCDHNFTDLKQSNFDGDKFDVKNITVVFTEVIKEKL
jgi:hypothetical protein